MQSTVEDDSESLASGSDGLSEGLLEFDAEKAAALAAAAEKAKAADKAMAAALESPAVAPVAPAVAPAPVKPAKKKPAIKLIEEPANVKYNTGATVKAYIVPQAQHYTKQLIAQTAASGTEFAYLSTPDNAQPLSRDSPWFPDYEETLIQVVEADTFDAAIAMSEGKFLEGSQDIMPVCVLNHANASTAGGGWAGGAPAQEEQLFYRSTLCGSLRPRFYPMGKLECLYSPHVIIFRENRASNFKLLKDLEKNAEKLPVVSVISMAAAARPKLNADSNGYAKDADRALMYGKMEQILRTAAAHNHRRLILGALGCGAFGHPVEDVIALWCELLEQDEFQNWFEQIVFAIFDRSAAKTNVKAFKEGFKDFE
ncbi:unnamed protein product [Penicillium salamii]|nr:unnamed protein product [Penicillium salamii]CAG8415977.1 unnamed protein product [Penicillium salamii]